MDMITSDPEELEKLGLLLYRRDGGERQEGPAANSHSDIQSLHLSPTMFKIICPQEDWQAIAINLVECIIGAWTCNWFFSDDAGMARKWYSSPRDNILDSIDARIVVRDTTSRRLETPCKPGGITTAVP